MKLFDDNIRENQYELKTFLHFLVTISNHHYRNSEFFNKINQILQNIQDIIKKYFSNFEIFQIFKSSKKLLLFLIDSKIISIDESIAIIMTSEKYQTAKYPLYFSTELKPFLSSEKYNEIQKEIPENFEERRKNDDNGYFLNLIQKDSIEDFIVYVNKENLNLSSRINPSIYETSSFILQKKTYAN